MKLYALRRRTAEMSRVAKDEHAALVPYLEDRDDVQVAPEVVDAELVEEPTTPTPTPTPGPQVVPPPFRWSVKAERVPVVPAWAREWAQVKAAGLWALGHAAHTVAFHGLRVPRYAARMVAYTPRGAGRTVLALSRWARDTESLPLRYELAQRGKSAEHAGHYHRLTQQRDRHVRNRMILVVVVLVATIAAVVVLRTIAPAWCSWAVCVALVASLGAAGSRRDKPLFDPAVLVAKYRKLTADIILRAYAAAGLCKVDDPVLLVSPPARDGDGWHVRLDLPYGRGFVDAVKAHDKLASGIDVSSTQVFLDRDASSARRVSMWVADVDPLAVPSGSSPLLRTPKTNIWQPVPLGVDERGQQVDVDLLWSSVLVGALPRRGKTFTARLFGLHAALDPDVRLFVYDGKGSPDWKAFEKVAYRCGFGLVLGPDGDPAQHMLDALLELKADVESRYQRLRELPVSVCPEGKLTEQLARSRPMRMPVTVVIVDEVQEYILHPTLGKDIAEVMTYLARVAPAVGVSMVTSTQKPDSAACPSQLRDQHQIRLALQVPSWQVSEVVLGAGSYSEGLDASRLLPSHKGVGILRGARDTGVTVRSYFASGEDAAGILARARQLREQAGTLDGQAAGDKPTGEQVSLVDDLDAVLAGEDKQHSRVLCARLAELRPGVYAGLDPTTLAAQLSRYGVQTTQVWVDGSNAKGVRRSDLAGARPIGTPIVPIGGSSG